MNEYCQPVRAGACYDAVPCRVMICLLGNFRLLCDGHVVSTRGGGKTEALLAYLGLQSGRRVPREQLVDLLWSASDLSCALKSLNSLVYRLHKLLGPALQDAPPVLHEDGYYRLHVEAGIGTDVQSFDLLAQTGDQQLHMGDSDAAVVSYRRAAELYRGDLRSSLDIQTLVEGERLRSRYLTLLGELADHCYRSGDYTACAEYAWRLLARDPCREDAHRLIMRCYVRRGERAAALRHYQVCTDLLQAEFDAPPESATVALFDQIRLQPDQM